MEKEINNIQKVKSFVKAFNDFKKEISKVIVGQEAVSYTHLTLPTIVSV